MPVADCTTGHVAAGSVTNKACVALQLENWLDDYYCITPFSNCANDTADWVALNNPAPPPPPPLSDPGCMPTTNSSTMFCMPDWGA